MTRSAFALALGIALLLPVSAQVHKWTDPSGRVHYGDQPPADAKSEQLKLDIKSYEGPVQVTDWAAIIRKKSPGVTINTQTITMYSTSWCVHCKRARNYFASKGIRYNDVDVEASAAGRQEFKELGGGGVPLILVRGKVMRGFNEESMAELLKGS